MADKLLPCPFCGGKAELEYTCNGLPYFTTFKTFCNNCGICIQADSEEEAVERWNNRPSPWHTGTPTVNDPFYVREVFILQFATPTGGWYFHGHLFKPDFNNKCFRSWVDKSITFAFDCPDLWWQKIEPYVEATE